MAAEPYDQAGSAMDIQPTDRITLDEIVMSKAGPSPPHAPALAVIGWRAFLVLMVFIGLSYAVMTVFAWATYPSPNDFLSVGGAGPTAGDVPRVFDRYWSYSGAGDAHA
jgi:hypothetical protein